MRTLMIAAVLSMAGCSQSEKDPIAKREDCEALVAPRRADLVNAASLAEKALCVATGALVGDWERIRDTYYFRCCASGPNADRCVGAEPPRCNRRRIDGFCDGHGRDGGSQTQKVLGTLLIECGIPTSSKP